MLRKFCLKIPRSVGFYWTTDYQFFLNECLQPYFQYLKIKNNCNPGQRYFHHWSNNFLSDQLRINTNFVNLHGWQHSSSLGYFSVIWELKMTPMFSRHHKTQNGVTSAIWQYLRLVQRSTTTGRCDATSVFLLYVNISNPERDMWEYSGESLIQTHIYTHTHRCGSVQWPIYFPTCALLFPFPNQQQLFSAHGYSMTKMHW